MTMEFLKAYWVWIALILVIAAIALFAAEYYEAAASLEMLLPGGGEG